MASKIVLNGSVSKQRPMRDLNYGFKQLCRQYQDGSFATQTDRERTLELCADQLYEMSYVKLQAIHLKPKHINALVERWKAEELSAGTIKNRLACLRWLVEKISKQNIMARNNEAYGIADRVYVTNISKSKELDQQKLTRITDPFTDMALRLQAAFGLRLAESIKIQPTWADRGDMLVLKASWTKGGRAREIPIRTDVQRQLLNDAKHLANGGSLIPPHMRYKDQLNRFKGQCQAAGIHKVHGHRHMYAQERYAELTGWKCPAQGGPTSKQLTPEQKRIDRATRMAISRELGHGREQITAIYLGR